MKKLLVILLSLSLMAFTIGDTHYFDVKKGNEKYEKGSYDEALMLYERAYSKKESDVSKYNLGNAHYRKGDYDEAARNFSAMLNSTDAELASRGLKNFAASNQLAGFDTAVKNDSDSAIINLKTATSAYKKILLTDRTDKSAKENLEIALNKIKELEKEKQKSQDENQEDKKQNDQEKSKQQNSQDKKQSDKGDDKEKTKGEKGEQKQKSRESADSKQKGKMTPEEVERILEALAQNEEKLQKQLRQNRTRNYEVEKDW